MNLHMMFLGNPGTGKTTIARKVTKMLYDLDCIRINKLVEVSRQDFIGEHSGETAPKVEKVIESAMGGVLFVDEAYSLKLSDNDQFGSEAIATLIKCMEDNKDELVVIFAGYTKEMQEFIHANSGIKSRIGYTIEFADYSEDELYEIAEDKFLAARAGTDFDEAIRAIDKELVGIYLSTGREDKARNLSERIFYEEPSLENFQTAFDNLYALGLFEEAIDFYNQNGRGYEDAGILFSLAFAYNQIQNLEKSKMHLLKTIAIDPDFTEAYLHLGHMSKGDEAKRYLEKYIELQGMAISGYLHLISLYKDDQQYDNIRTLMQEVLTAQGISEETLFIAINALKSLYEYDKIYDLYNGNSLIKDDPILLGAALNALSEEEDYIDFVEEEVVTYFDVLHDDPTYVETLRNVYDLTGSPRILDIINHFEHHHGPRGHH